jgi:GTPase SAR1 family protein
MSRPASLKVVFSGSLQSGKTCLLDQLVNSTFFSSYKPTIGCDFLSHNITHPTTRQTFPLQLWEISGDKRYEAAMGTVRNKMNVGDITSQSSFDDIQYFHDAMKPHFNNGSPPVFLLGMFLSLVIVSLSLFREQMSVN